MNWNATFAHRTTHMRRSAVREILKLTGRPEMISFGGGLPAPELFPVEETREAAVKVLKERGSSSLQYSETEGNPGLRDWIAARYSSHGTVIGRENVVITSGAQQGLDLLGRLFIEKGDRVAIENPAYLALLSAWRPFEPEFVPVASDEGGMKLESLAEALKGGAKLIYTVPNFQNPQGTTLAADRRAPLIELAVKAGAGVIEDDPYGELRFSGEAPPRLLDIAWKPGAKNLEEHPVIHVGTFSKVLAPGLRVGWVIAPESVIDCLVRAKQAADLHTNTLSQWIALELAKDGCIERQLPRLREAYRQRRDVMLAALQEFMPEGVSWTRPEGGMFLLATLPEGMDGAILLRKAIERNVAFVPGAEFYVGGGGTNTMRLNYSNASPEKIRIGIERLAGAVREMNTLGNF